MLNIVLFVIGLVALFFGLKYKLKYLLVIGAIFIAFGLLSAYVDYKTTGSWMIDNHRIPFVIDHMM